MTSFRCHIHNYRSLATLVLVLALLMKIMIPTGYMATPSNGTITVELCGGYEHKQIVVTIPGLAEHQKKQNDHRKGNMPCAFSGLSAPGLAATDPILLVLAIAFIVATAFRASAVERVSIPAFLRPPSRGPPTIL